METGQIDDKAIFNTARRIEDRAARSNYLREACGDDHVAFERIGALLRIHDEEQSFLESPAVEAPTAGPSPIAERPGAIIGPYKLLQQIGEGGMGVVFMAEQERPIHRTVALKIIKPGMDTRPVIARFEAERQALAMMDHPNIARVIDAGTTDTGRPYFVMELVKGVPVTKFCDDHKLTLRQRLELFKPVCEAVQHAHQKGIIHRDLKPTNVLVAEYDNRPVPKVIDFGVAKATAQKLTERTMFTEFGQVIGTVEYMSPEQAKFNQLDIDTRSDIYSLGVLLYELLTGSTPFERERLREAAFDEVLRIIREEEPPKPSTRLSNSDKLPSIAANRHTEPARLSKDIRGELDWIVMRSLEKDRQRRYQTASAFADDLARYLTDQPVEACPPSTSYRLRKFVLRNKVTLFAGGAIAGALVVGIVVSTWQAIRATRAEAAATIAQTEAEANFEQAMSAVDEMLSQVGQKSLADIPQMEPVRRVLLEKALAFYQQFLEQKQTVPRVRLESARAYQRVSEIYSMIGGGSAFDASQQAISILDGLAKESPHTPIYREEMARDFLWQAGLFAGSAALVEGYAEKAMEADEKAYVILKNLVAEYPDEPRYAYALAGATGAMGRRFWGEREDDQPRYRLIPLRRVDQRGSDPKNDQRYEAAAAYYSEAIDLYQRTASRFAPKSNDNVVLCGLYDGHSVVLRRLGRHDEAEHALRQAIDVWKQLIETAPTNTEYRTSLGRIYYRLGELLEVAGRAQQAEQPFRDGIAIQEALVQDFPNVPQHRWNLTFTLDDLGQLLRRSGAQEAAKKEFSRAADAYKPTVKKSAEGRDRLAILLRDAGRYDEAITEFRQALDIRGGSLGEVREVVGPRFQIANDFAQIADLLQILGRHEEAVSEYSSAAKLMNLSDTQAVTSYEIANASDFVDYLDIALPLRGGGDAYDYFILAMIHSRLNHQNEARTWYDKAVDRMEKNKTKNEELARIRAETANLLGISKVQKL